MILSDLSVNSKLVDIITGEVVGYMLMNDIGQVVALTKSEITKLDKDLSDYIDYVDANVINVLSHNNKYALEDNSLYFDDNYNDLPFYKKEDKVAIYGYFFNSYNLVELDNQTAINNVINYSEKY